MNVELLFEIANALYLVGTILLTIGIIKNKDTLYGFNPYGSLIKAFATIITSIALIKLELYTASIILIPTLVFWIITSFYSFRDKRIIDRRR